MKITFLQLRIILYQSNSRSDGILWLSSTLKFQITNSYRILAYDFHKYSFQLAKSSFHLYRSQSLSLQSISSILIFFRPQVQIIICLCSQPDTRDKFYNLLFHSHFPPPVLTSRYRQNHLSFFIFQSFIYLDKICSAVLWYTYFKCF